MFSKAGRVLAGKAEKEATLEFRSATLAELGAETVSWTNYKDTHIIRGSNVNWKEVIKSTRGPRASAKYLPQTDVEMLERGVWQNGTPVTNGKNWRVYEFKSVIGASDGKEVRWVRVEATGGPGSLVIHGHPITQQEYQRLIKP